MLFKTMAALTAIAFSVIAFAQLNKMPKIVLTKDNTIELTSEVTNAAQMYNIIDQIRAHKTSDQLYLIINSPGGSVLAGEILVKFLHNDDHNVTCVVNEYAASMANHILQACKTRVVQENSYIIMHQLQIGAQGNLSKVEQTAALGEQIAHILYSEEAKRLELPLDEYIKRIHDEWHLYGAEEILKNHAADYEAVVTCDPKFTGKKKAIIGSFFGVNIEGEVDVCPLYR